MPNLDTFRSGGRRHRARAICGRNAGSRQCAAGSVSRTYAPRNSSSSRAVFLGGGGGMAGWCDIRARRSQAATSSPSDQPQCAGAGVQLRQQRPDDLHRLRAWRSADGPRPSVPPLGAVRQQRQHHDAGWPPFRLSTRLLWLWRSDLSRHRRYTAQSRVELDEILPRRNAGRRLAPSHRNHRTHGRAA